MKKGRASSYACARCSGEGSAGWRRFSMSTRWLPICQAFARWFTAEQAIRAMAAKDRLGAANPTQWCERSTSSKPCTRAQTKSLIR